MRLIYADISTAPIEGAAAFLDESSAPDNYKDPVKIAAYIADAKQKAMDRAGLDFDLGRITGIAMRTINQHGHDCYKAFLCKDHEQERDALASFALEIGQRNDAPPATLVGFNSKKFDWPMLMRRARYLGVKLTINLDRYRSPHIDVSEAISNYGQLPVRSLKFYCQRLGWSDLCKTLDGAEEARIFEHQRWDDLTASLEHDVEATRRLHAWWEQR